MKIINYVSIYLLNGMVRILLTESFLLHQHHVSHCMPCLVMRISTKSNGVYEENRKNIYEFM